MDQLVDSFGIENVLSVVVLVLGTVGSADLIAQLAECVSVVAFARVTDADGARNALDLTTPDVAIVAMSATWAEAVLGERMHPATSSSRRVRMLALGEKGTVLERRRSHVLGADGFVDPNCDTTSLRRLLEQVTDVGQSALGSGAADVGTLTRREEAVVELIAEGYSNRQIARTLSISDATVKNHVHSLLGKLHTTNRAQAGVAWSSRRRGWH